MKSGEREQRSACGYAGASGPDDRSPMLAQGMFEVDLLRKNERKPADDEFTDDEAEAFGFC